ncbi:chain-length determining protein [Allochromatium vinosum]|uniref:Chain length determinant protein n=1 Tax=Allochromatium vinosum (strain ATCC 17899 / DSM 180 / NBRC 103801 / NCIMB 10441 / D) TaxID=572477 RepID=D3RMB9_ALLVD|nr:chain-length determining protein [Allochromatium vinosum]ADC61177.1 chain length determinant protein [Allochromatium vinosum DSM 180]MBK1654656.1 chain-length determining protein [Allochromatium vinosum]
MKPLRQNPLWTVILFFVLGATLYWSFIASDRFVSRANVVLLSAQISKPDVGLSAILRGMSNNDLLILRDFMRSTDMLARLQTELDLRAHYSNSDIDWFSRLSAPDVPTETFHRYVLKRLSIEFDEYAQVLRISAQAYDPGMAQRIVALLLEAGEEHMNVMGHRLAEEQVHFIEKQVEVLHQRMLEDSERMLSYQNEHGLVSPTETVGSLSGVIAKLEGELAGLQARKAALSVSQSERAPEMMKLDSEIKGMREQIATERARLARASGDALNRLAAEYELLRLQYEFSNELYSSAVTALENTRVEAARALKQVSVLQTPTLPEYSTQPRRLYNITVFAILAALTGIILQLLLAIIRDHKD